MASPGDIKAGKAFVELYLEDSKFAQGMNRAANQIKALGLRFSQIGLVIGGVGAAVLTPIITATKMFMSTGDSLDKMSVRVGASVEFLSALGHAAKTGGIDLEEMEVGIKRMQKAAYGNSKAFRELGIDVRDSSGNLKSTKELFMEVAGGMSGVENNTTKAALALTIFGRSGTALLPMLRGGKEGVLGLMEEAKRLGIVMSTEDATAAAKLTDAMERVWASVKRVALEVGAALAGPLTEMQTTVLKTGKRMGDWVRANRETIVAVAKLAATVVAAGAAFTGIGGALIGLSAILKAVGVAMAFAISPLGLLTVGLVGVALVLRQAAGGAAVLSSEMQNLLAEGDRLRASDQQRFTRLQELSRQQSLNAAQMDEASETVRELQSRYGGLNVHLDRMTGSLTMGTDALNQFNVAMAKVAVQEVNARIGELEHNLRELQRVQFAPGRKPPTLLAAAKAAIPLGKAAIPFGAGGALPIPGLEELTSLDVVNGLFPAGATRELLGKVAGLDYAASFRDEAGAIWESIRALEARRKALLGGDRQALTAEAGGAPGLAGIGGGTAGDAAKSEAELRKRLTELQIAGIQDEATRDRLAIDEKYKYELAAAIRAGTDLKLLQEAWDQERLNSAAEFAKRRAEAEKQAAEESADRKRNLERETARAQIDATLTGRAKEEALLTQEWEERRQDALRQGMDTTAIDELFKIKRQALDAKNVMGTTARGTYSAEGASLLGGGGVGRPMAQLEDINKRQLQQLERIEQHLAFGQNWV